MTSRLRRPGLRIPMGVFLLATLLFGHPLGCGSETKEPPRVALSVYIVGLPPRPVVNDLGFSVRLTGLRLAVADLGFTVAGEEHATARFRPAALLLATAWAHPGHLAGGEVTGELAGRYVLDPLGGAGEELGLATLLPGSYDGLNLSLRRATEEERSGPDDLLPGHTAILSGIASGAGASIPFEAVVDEPEGTVVLGGAFGLEVSGASSDALGLAFSPEDPATATTIFDGIDFAGLPVDLDGVAVLGVGSPAHALLAAALARHCFWGIDLH